MDTAYRLVIASVFVPWKAYTMSHEIPLMNGLLSLEVECLIMVFGKVWVTLASAIYNAIGAFIRYWFVKSSLKVEVQESIKGEKFKLYCIIGPQVKEPFEVMYNDYYK